MLFLGCAAFMLETLLIYVINCSLFPKTSFKGLGECSRQKLNEMVYMNFSSLLMITKGKYANCESTNSLFRLSRLHIKTLLFPVPGRHYLEHGKNVPLSLSAMGKYSIVAECVHRRSRG